MLQKGQNIGYYLFAISNFIAALGGGMILGKGVSVIDNPLLQGGSVLAFFVGTVLGLLFLQCIPKKLSLAIVRWFSIFAAGISVGLLCIFNAFAIEGKLDHIYGVVFFILLSIRFGFWFYSRVLRASAAAGQQQNIALVELGYYSGMVGGLIVWSILGIQLGMAAALIIDACLQFSAGLIDLYVYYMNPSNTTTKPTESTKTIRPEMKKRDKIWLWQLAMASTSLIVGSQVIIFNISYQVVPYFSPYILGFYYIGVSIAAYFCKAFNIQLHWDFKENQKTSFAMIRFTSKGKDREISITLNGCLTALCVGIVVMGVMYWQWGTMTSPVDNTFLFGIGEFCVLTFVVISAFFQTILCLSILDRIGLEERASNHQGMVMRTYGLMGVGAAVSLWILGITESSVLGLLVTLSLSIVLVILFTQRKLSYT